LLKYAAVIYLLISITNLTLCISELLKRCPECRLCS